MIRKGITIITFAVHRSSSSSIDQIDIGIITQDYGTDQRPASCCPIGIGSSHIRLPVASLSPNVFCNYIFVFVFVLAFVFVIVIAFPFLIVFVIPFSNQTFDLRDSKYAFMRRSRCLSTRERLTFEEF